MSDSNSENKTDDKKPDTKTDRIDRMEKKMELIEKGLLVLVNLVRWNNDTITPIGTHDSNIKFQEYDDLAMAVIELYPESEDGN